MSIVRLAATIERFPIAGTFTISRGSKREAVVVHVTHSEDGLTYEAGRILGMPALWGQP